MTSTPKITAMMLVRDRGELIEEAAHSVLIQSESDLELVILDDGSKDNSWEIAKAIAASDSRVRLLRNEHSIGIPAARNRVLTQARGQYIAICDSDDISRPNRFRISCQLLDVDDTLAGVGGLISVFSADPQSGRVPSWHWGLKDGRLPFSFPSAMFRREAIESVGGFDERFAVCEDLDLCYRLVGADWKFAQTNEVLTDYRTHEGSITAHRPPSHQWLRVRAQLRGLISLKGRFSLRGYMVIGQSLLRLTVDALRNVLLRLRGD